MSMKAEIISIGTELLLGDIVNTNAGTIAKTLAKLGIDLYYITTVGDNPDRMLAAIKQARGRSDLIITTGGLGPTSDDITRQVVAKAFNRPLLTDERGKKMIETYYEKSGRAVPAGAFSQALYPEGGHLIFNAQGTAPGIFVEDENVALIAMPGVSEEMKTMLAGPVTSLLQKKTDGFIIRSKILRVYGKGESEVENILHDLILAQTNPTIAPLAQTGEVLIRLTCKAESEEKAFDCMAPIVAEIESRLGKHIYGSDEKTMPAAVADLLTDKGLTLAVAESCTGGLIADRLTDIPGASKFLKGAIVAYSNEFKQKALGVLPATLEKYGAVSREVALEMVRGLEKLYKADISLAVTGIAGPDGGSPKKPLGTVCFAYLAQGSEASEVKHISYKDRLNTKMIASTHGLDIIRRYIENNF